MSDEWWDPSHDLPAFRTRRTTFGDSKGGDYVRGSEDARVPAAALRYRSVLVDLSTLATTARGLLHVQPYVTYFVPATSQEEVEHTDAYHTIFLEFNWPEALKDIWKEYAVVRSSYGHPVSPGQGITLERKLSTDPDLTKDALGDFKPKVILDTDLVAGRWYYYTVFFRTTPGGAAAADWQGYMSDSCLLPKNYGHASRLWDAVPPYYQLVDDNIRAYDGYLSRFLRVIGFMQDNVRGFVEGLLELHWIDRSPMPLLQRLGDNYGMPYEQGLGDIRYRALLANLTHLLEVRGTAVGIEELIETVSQYECDVVTSDEAGNHLLLPADSDPYTSAGHWAPIHPDTDMNGKGGPAKATYLTYDKVQMVPDSTPSPPPVSGARGALEIWTSSGDATGELFITCGDGKRVDTTPTGPVTSTFTPLYAGMPCRPGQPFGFSVWVQSEVAGVTVTSYLLFFSSGGAASDLLHAYAGGTTPAGTAPAWIEFPHGATAPASSYYVVPALLFENRSGTTGANSKIIRIGAAMVYSVVTGAPVAVGGLHAYLVMGDPSDKIGEPPKPGDATFKGFVIGQPRSDL